MRLTKKRKVILSVISLLILVPAIGAGVWLLLQDQDTRTGAAAAKAKVTFSPTTATKAVGEEFDVTVIPNPDSAGGGSAHAVDVILQFNPDKLEIISVQKGINPGTYPYQDKSTQIDNTDGKARLSWIAYDSALKTILPAMTTPTPIGIVKFKVKAEGGNNIDLVYSGPGQTLDSNIVQSINNDAIDNLSEKTSLLVNGGGSSTGGGGDDGGGDGGGNESKGDVNGDGKITLADYSIFVQDYTLCRNSESCNTRSDFDNNGDINIDDYLVFLNAYLANR